MVKKNIAATLGHIRRPWVFLHSLIEDRTHRKEERKQIMHLKLENST